MKEVKGVLGNVYYDSAASPYLYDRRIFRAAVLLAGVEKVLFGSDYPLLGIARCAAQVDDLETTERDAILGGNAARLLGLA
jgi:predicted TIM-barrel fold metal-dependent hydrolase